MIFRLLRSLAREGPTGRDRDSKPPMGRMVIRSESLLVVEKAAGNDRNVVCFINGFLFA